MTQHTSYKEELLLQLSTNNSNMKDRRLYLENKQCHVSQLLHTLICTHAQILVYMYIKIAFSFRSKTHVQMVLHLCVINTQILSLCSWIYTV